jgi:hypothetical protein
LPTSALLLTLAAAVIHASWNLLLSAEEDTHSATAAAIANGSRRSGSPERSPWSPGSR